MRKKARNFLGTAETPGRKPDRGARSTAWGMTDMGHNQRSTAAGIFAAVLLSTGSAVLAQPDYALTNISVRTHDIDLSTPAGADMLQRRVETGVRSACGPVEFVAGDEARALTACRTAARQSAEPQLRRALAAGSLRMAAI